MTRILLLLLFIDCFLTQLVFSHYSNNEAYNRGYNQMDKEEEATNEYNQRFDAYNQQQRSQSYPSESKETPMPYHFQYNTNDGYGNKQDRHEKADEYGNVVGSYGYIDSNGIYRKVHYTAGPEGFKASINSNEPNLKKNANPADVMLTVEDPPQNALNSVNYVKQQMNYQRDEPIADNYEDNNNTPMRDQIYRASFRHPLTAQYNNVNNNDYGFGGMKTLLDMFRPKQNGNRNQDYKSLDTFTNGNQNNNEDIEAYASNRRYYD